MRTTSPLIAAALVLGTALLVTAQSPSTQPAVPPLLNVTMKTLDGKDQPLSKYAGKVMLIVNTASKCGFAPQLEGLEALNKKYAGQGLAVVGFASDNFKNQEFATAEETAEFCRTKGVAFDMFAKTNVTGEAKSPLFQMLTSASGNGVEPGEIKWNFEKFLISRDGEVVARFRSKVKPDDAELTKAIEAELAKPAK